ncbi:MAG: AmmeMemoRadiSam system protein B [Planctomycetia bacterium]|nr:AmmeMemoRadiSam system protein B [Planctomycetia bacterium]
MEHSVNIRPSFTEAQKKAIFLTAGRKVAMSVCRMSHKIRSEDLEGTADFPVYGVFVSLKRFGQLRACCGFLGEHSLLGDALDEAAMRAAVEDFRFPVIHSSELHEMEMEVWILVCPERIVAKDESIFKFIELGKHGLQVFRGQRRGLLLPGVATEHHMDPLQFLEQTCIKAGLPKDAWMDPYTAVFRFEGYSITGHVKDTLDPSIPVDPPESEKKGPDARNLAWLADHCFRNIQKKMNGGIPDIYLPGAYDGMVNGACIRLKMAHQYMDCAHVSFQREVPLQSTLLNVAENATSALKNHHIKSLLGIHASLCVFWDVHLIGTAEKCSLEDVDTKEYGVIVHRNGRWTLCFNPKREAESLLADALGVSEFLQDEDTAVYLTRVRATESSFITSTVQVPLRDEQIRHSAVAGMFYPDGEKQMKEQLDRMLAENDAPENIQPNQVFQPWGGKFFVAPKKAYTGALVPHAGWQYSGRLAAQTLAQIEFPRHIFIFAPKHKNIGVDWAVAPFEKWNLPVRSMDGDPRMAQQLTEAVPEFQLDALAHREEHSIEVLLPILARLAPGSRILGIQVNGKSEKIPEVSKQLARWISTLPQRPLLIASSDMNHYATDNETRKLDAPVLDAICRCAPEEMLRSVQEKNVSMCGCLPTALVMMTLREMSLLNHAVKVGYATSGDVTGDKRQVVGYAGILFE